MNKKPVIHCLYDKLVSPDDLLKLFNPKNRNDHPPDQIKRLVKILKYQGIRYPIKISKLSGLITSGHGRVLASKEAGFDKIPVVYQDYANEDQEYADLQSDNAISSWSELNYAKINLDIANLGPEFDIDLLGIKNFTVDISEKQFNPSVSTDEEKPHKQCPNCGHIL